MFKREVRYVVLKISDIDAALTPFEHLALAQIEASVANQRIKAGKQPFECVVVESDWPEYEPTWKAIEERMEQEREDNGQFGVGA